MDTLTLLLIVFLGLLASTALGWFGKHWTLRQRVAVQGPRGPHRCERCLCELPTGTLRTHDGHWRCADHKGRV
jgi:hypothetical protein